MPRATIMVVEDEASVALVMKAQLEKLGYDVAPIATTASEAVQIAQQSRPEVALMDIRLKGGTDGVDAAEMLSDRLGIPTIFATCVTDPSTLDRARVTDPFGYLVKPVEEHQLHMAIEIARCRHRLERASEEWETWLRGVIGAVSDGVIATDAQGLVRFVNPVASQLTGLAAVDALGRPVTGVLEAIRSDDAPAPSRSPVESLLDGGERAKAIEFDIVTHGSVERRAVPIECECRFMRGPRGDLLGKVLVFRDTTERKRAEALRRANDERMRQAQKMHALGILSAGVAHHINNLLQVMMGNSDLILGEVSENTPVHDLAQRVLNAGRRAAQIISHLGQLGRTRPRTADVTDVGPAIEELLPLLNVLVPESIALKVQAQGEGLLVDGDSKEIEQIVVSLVTNARDAMLGGGTLGVRTGAIDQERDEEGRATPGRSRSYVFLEVSDSGCGMSTEVQGHLFEPFFTTKGPDRGVGLGLYTAYTVAQRLGGFIDVRSVIGQGSTFTVCLPRNKGKGVGVSTSPRVKEVCPEPPGQPALSGGETILVAEDDDDLRELVTTELRRLGYVVLEGSDGAQALRVADEAKGPIDVFLSDLVMPVLDGVSAARRLVERRPALRVIFMTGYNDDTAMLDNCPWTTLLHKPFRLRDLARRLREVIDAPAATRRGPTGDALGRDAASARRSGAGG